MMVLAAPLLAHAGALNGPLITNVLTDKVSYAPGAAASITIALKNTGSSTLSDTISVAIYDRDTLLTTLIQAAPILAPNASGSLTLSWTPPNQDHRGYLLAVSATGNLPDNQTGAIDVASEPYTMPRECWVSSAGLASVTTTLAALATHYCNLLQGYDIAYKHDLPYSSGSSWPNLGGATIQRSAIQALVSGAHTLGAKVWIYNLWNGAYPNFATDGSGYTLAMGEYQTQCAPTCGSINMNATPVNSVFMDLFCANNPGFSGYGQTCTGTRPGNVFPSSWSAESILLMDAGNPQFRAAWQANMTPVISNLAYDGCQIDTLGSPGQQWDFNGKAIDLSLSVAPFATAARATACPHDAINGVSQWSTLDVAANSTSDVVYEELWPSDTPSYPAINRAAATVRSRTTRGIEFPSYMFTAGSGSVGVSYADSQYGCAMATTTALPATPPGLLPGGQGCFVNEPDLRLVEATFLAAGADHLTIGDGDKYATNIYWPGPMLPLYPSTMLALLDLETFGVAYERMLRIGASDAPEPVSLTGAPYSLTDAPGAVWTLPKTAAGLQILHLFNHTALTNLNYKDLPGTTVIPPQLGPLLVTQHYFGAPVQPSGALWWASPDVRHGVPQPLTYTMGVDGAGNYVQFSLPSLLYYDMVWLKTQGLSGYDFDINAYQPFRAISLTSGSNGFGLDQGALGLACCGRQATWEGMQFGTPIGAVSLQAKIASPNGGTFQVYLDNTANAPITNVFVQPTGSWNNFTYEFMPVLGVPTGRHTLIVRFPDTGMAVQQLQFVSASTH